MEGRPTDPARSGVHPAVTAQAGHLASAGYFFPLLKTTETLAGALLLAGTLVPFALTLLAPIIVNIAAFHLFLAPGNYAVVAVVLAAEIYLTVVHRAAFAPLFARPGRRVEAGVLTALETAERRAA